MLHKFAVDKRLLNYIRMKMLESVIIIIIIVVVTLVLTPFYPFQQFYLLYFVAISVENVAEKHNDNGIVNSVFKGTAKVMQCEMKMKGIINGTSDRGVKGSRGGMREKYQKMPVWTPLKYYPEISLGGMWKVTNCVGHLYRCR
jgi:hypothetical protein